MIIKIISKLSLVSSIISKYKYNFTKTSTPLFGLKDYYMNRQYAHSLNPIIPAFETQVLSLTDIKEIEQLFQNLIQPKEEDLTKVQMNIEFFTLILLEKIIIIQNNKQEDDNLSTIYNLYHSLMFTYLQNFRPQSFLFLIHILAREPLQNKRIFRIFEFIIMRTAFANILGEEELMQLIEDCDKFYQIIEEDSFLEIFEKIEKILFEKYQKEFKLSAENITKLAFTYSTHKVGSHEFYEKIYKYYNQNFEIMVTKEIITIIWSLLNSGYFDKKQVIHKKVREIIQNDIDNVEEYYQNLYFYSLKKDSSKSWKFKINFFKRN